jgi:DNA-binding NarL/FixJ family response regulator
MTPQNIRALIVEDDNSWQQIMSEILSDCGLNVDIAGSFEEAIHLLKSQPHRLAVVDLSLSPNEHNNQDGLRVLDNMKRLDPNCRAILLTGFATVELAVTSLTDYGAFTFLRKESFQRSQFKDIVHRILVSAPQTAGSENPLTKPPTLVSKFPAYSINNLADEALIVDDDAGWRSILEELLKEMNYQVHTCTSFGEALGVLRKENFSIAIIDLSLNEIINNQIKNGDEQELHGYQLLEITRENQIPTIVVSGVSESDEIQRIYSEYSISAYIEKQTFDRAIFMRILKDIKIASKATDELSLLTEREREVLELLAQGLANKEIAEKLVITTNTVKRHIKAIFEKLDVHTRSAVTAKVAGGKR